MAIAARYLFSGAKNVEIKYTGLREGEKLYEEVLNELEGTFPKIANKSLQCELRDDPHLLLYNGMAFVSDDLRQLQVLKCFMESDVFWQYVSSNAKPYASGFYSLNG